MIRFLKIGKAESKTFFQGRYFIEIVMYKQYADPSVSVIENI